MKEKVKRWLTHNVLLKAVALTLAILTWLVFYSSEDPIIAAYFDLPVEVVNLEEFNRQGHYIAIEDEKNLDNLTLQVSIKARTSVIERMRTMDPTAFIRVFVDVYEIDESGVDRLMVHYEDTSRDPSLRFEFNELKNKSYYDVVVDNSVTKEIEVRYEISGTPEEGYMYLEDDSNIQISPEVITLTGPSNQLENIEYGKVTIRVAGANANINKKGDIVLHEADGDVVKYSRDVIRASVSEGSVFVPIYMKKLVKIQPYVPGVAPEGYEYGRDVSLSVSEVEIFGPESVVNRISSIALPAVDISEMTQNYKETIDLNALLQELYKGEVRIVDEEKSTTELTFSIVKQESRIFEFDTSKDWITGNQNDWEISFVDEVIYVEVVGLPSDLSAVDPENITLSIALKEEDFVQGRHEVSIKVGGLENLTLKSDPVAKLNFVRKDIAENSGM